MWWIKITSNKLWLNKSSPLASGQSEGITASRTQYKFHNVAPFDCWQKDHMWFAKISTQLRLTLTHVCCCKQWRVCFCFDISRLKSFIWTDLISHSHAPKTKRWYPFDQGYFVIKAVNQATEILCYILQKLLELIFWQILIQVDLLISLVVVDKLFESKSAPIVPQVWQIVWFGQEGGLRNCRKWEKM